MSCEKTTASLPKRRAKQWIKGRFLTLTGLLVLGLTVAQGHTADKVQFGTLKVYPPHYVTVLAAQEKGFWKEQGLEVEWVAMRGGAEVPRAAAARSISMGVIGTVPLILAMTRGVPVAIVSGLKTKTDFWLFVRPDSPYKEPKDLKGAKIGVTGLGAATHAYGQVIIKAAGIEKEVKFVGSGGIIESMAALKARAVDGVVQTGVDMAPLIASGEVRELATVADYLPKDWEDLGVFALKEMIRDKPEVVGRMVRAILKAADFAMTNRSWTVEKIKATQGVSEEVARLIFERLGLSRTGRIERKAVENLRNFIVEYGLVPKGTTVPPVDELYTPRFTD